MRRILLAYFLAHTAAVSGAPMVCPGLKSDVEEDHRVLETQLTYQEAKQALAFIEMHKGTKDWELQHGLNNSQTILRGYALLSLAQSGEGEQKAYYTKQFCEWLSRAAWHD